MTGNGSGQTASLHRLSYYPILGYHRVAAELDDLKKSSGLFIFDIAKLRDFICYSRELRA